MSLVTALSPVVPVFVLTAVGFTFARYRRISLDAITEYVVYLGAPALVFTSLATKPLYAVDIAVIAVGALGILAGVGLLIFVYRSITGLVSAGFTLPVLFMNAGNMGIPLALFAFGEPGLQRGTLFYVVITLVHNTLGIYLLGGHGGAREIFRLPLIYAAVLGLVCNLFQFKVPPPIFEPLSVLGLSVIPLMLVSLGYRLRSMESFTFGHALAGAAIRVIGGFAAAYALVTLVGIDGINRQVIILYGSLPSAVINFMLTEKYGRDPELAASIIFFSTVLCLLSVPFVLWFLGRA
jgi:malate permease and related proteins